MNTTPRYYRTGCTVWRAAARPILVGTYANEFVAAVRLRAFIRLDGGRLGRIHP